MMGQKPQQCFLMPILVGTDGVQKMSKSLDNYVAVEEAPNDMYGKLMSLPDKLIAPYFEYLTDTSDQDLEEMSQALQSDSVNPMELKKRLAQEITATFYDAQTAKGAQENFERVVQRRDLPEDIPEAIWTAGQRLSGFLVESNLATSTSEAKRLISQNAVQLIRSTGDSETLSDDAAERLQAGDVIKVGRRRFVRLTD